MGDTTYMGYTNMASLLMGTNMASLLMGIYLPRDIGGVIGVAGMMYFPILNEELFGTPRILQPIW